jgi:glycerol-3-phosphate acyltransferase PlsY
LIAGYLFGSLSPAYWLGRRLGRVDLRHSGSGNLGATNVGVHFGRRAGMTVAILDALKALAPTLLALRFFGLDAAIAVAIGVVAGHNWSVLLRFTGGRGGICAAAAVAVFAPKLLLLALPIMALGYLRNNPAPALAMVLLLTVPFGIMVKLAPIQIAGAAAIGTLLFLKRLHANGLTLPAGERRSTVLLRRLWWDRDIADDGAWQHRQMARGAGK